MQPTSKTRTLFLIRNDHDSNISIIIANNSHSREGNTIIYKGKCLEEVSTLAQSAIFQTTHKTSINPQNIIQTQEIKCQEQSNRVTMTLENYQQLKAIMAEL